MKLFDNFSKLHQYKLQHGLNRAENNPPSAYILECQLRRLLNDNITPGNILEISERSGLSRHTIRNIIESKVYKISNESVIQALEAYDTEGLDDCLTVLDKAPKEKGK